MARFAFVTWDGGGNQAPALALAGALRRHGHEVSFAGYAAQRARFEQAGFTFSELTRSSAAFSADGAADPFAHWFKHVLASPDHAQDIQTIAAASGCDALVIDCLMFGALAAAEAGTVPAVAFNHMAAGTLVEGGTINDLFLPAINDVRVALGREAVSGVWDAWGCLPTLCASLRELDPLAPTAPGHFAYVGPIREERGASSWRPPWDPDDRRPLVLVSFSTFHGFDQRSRLERTIEALARCPYRVLVTGMPEPHDAVREHEHIVNADFVPHDAVLPSTRVFVTHAGHGSVTASLAHGVPLVCLPNAPSDQPGLAAQLERLGAAKMLDGDLATPADIAAAVDLVLTDPAYAEAARRLARAITDAPGVTGAVRLLERAALDRQSFGQYTKL